MEARVDFSRDEFGRCPDPGWPSREFLVLREAGYGLPAGSTLELRRRIRDKFAVFIMAGNGVPPDRVGDEIMVFPREVRDRAELP